MAGTSLGALNVVLGMNTAAFSADTRKARTELAAFAANSNSAMVRLSQSLAAPSAGIKEMSERTLKMGGIARAALAYLAPAAFIAFGRSAFNAAAGLEEAAQQAGLSIGAYQALRNALQDNGVAFEQADVLLARFTKSIGQAKNEPGELRDMLIELGLGAKDLAGPPEQSIGKFVTALLKIPDAEKRARFETEFFARAGQKLESALVALGVPIEDLTAKYTEQGRIVKDDLAKRTNEASDLMVAAWQRLQVQITPGIVRMTDFITELTNAVNELAKAGPGTGGFPWARALSGAAIGAGLGTVVPGAGTMAGGALGFAAGTIHGFVKPNQPTAADLPFAGRDTLGIARAAKSGAATTAAGAAASEWQTRAQIADAKKALDEQTKAHEDYVRDWERGVVRIRGFEQDFLKEWKTETVVAWDDYKKFQLARPTLVENATERINAAYAREQEALALIHEGQKEMMRQEAFAADSLRYSVANVGVAALHGFGSFKQAVAGVLEQLAAMIIQLRVMKPIVEGLFGAEGSGFGGSIGGLIGSALGFIGGGGGLSGTHLDPGIQFKAAGGPVSAGRPYIVGEKGPETFVPRSSGNIVPNGGGMGGGEVVVRIELDNQMLRATVQSESGNVVARFNKQALPGRVRELTRDARLG